MTEETRGPLQDQVLDHSYDGIQEYDNRLPNWWLYTLYGAIVFAVCYWLYFHTLGVGKLPEAHYEQEMIEATEAQLARMAGQELTDETMTLMAGVPDRVAAGEAIFKQFCVVCHSQQGEGGVGPNLTDAYWIHGGRPLQIVNTITNGVPEKGMVAWGGQLGPRRVQDVAAFVLTLKNTNVPGKAPEGELETATLEGAVADSTTGGAAMSETGEAAPVPGASEAMEMPATQGGAADSSASGATSSEAAGSN